jgi:hypothetical protein
VDERADRDPPEEILKYMGEGIEENGLARHGYRHRIDTASRSSAEKLATYHLIRTMV